MWRQGSEVGVKPQRVFQLYGAWHKSKRTALGHIYPVDMATVKWNETVCIIGCPVIGCFS